MNTQYRRTAFVAVIAVCAWTTTACKRDARLADHKLRHPVVKTVSHYGITLDKNATPEQVAFVALRAIKEDFEAKDAAQRDEALDVLFDICAPNLIAAENRRSISRDEFIYKIVYHWTPAVAHYVHDFETEWARAKARFKTSGGRRGSLKSEKVEARALVQLEVSDPAGDANAGAIVKVDVRKDEGYWRVWQIGFASGDRSLGGASSAPELTAQSVAPGRAD